MSVRSILIGFVLLLAGPAFAADPPAPPPMTPTTGTVVSISATSLVIKGTDGKDATFVLAPGARVSKTHKGSVADVKAGQFIGTTAVEGPDGKLRATEIHIFPEGMRGTGEGHYPWGSQDKTTMTNGNVESLEGVSDGKTIKVTYKGGETTVIIPPSVEVTVIEAATIADVKVGSSVTVFATTGADGTKTALGIGVNS